MAESVLSIKEKLEKCTLKELDDFIAFYGSDERKGVIKMTETAKKRKQAYFDEQERLKNI